MSKKIATFKPMLADNSVLDLDNYAALLATTPMCVSTKIDGFRCLIKDGKALTRSLKPINNQYVREILSNPELNGMDGELIVGAECGHGVFARTSSAITRLEGTPQFTYCVFDHVNWDDISEPYYSRYSRLQKMNLSKFPFIKVVQQTLIENISDLLNFEQQVLANGYEGAIMRHPRSPYKFGRSTLKEAYLLKLKRFIHREAVIVSMEEKMHNDNVAFKDELGHTKRSSAQAGLRAAGTMGRVNVHDVEMDWKFGIGSFVGFTDAIKKEMWDNQEKYIGKLIRYKYAPVGMKDVPRHPVGDGIRDINDL